MRPFARRRWPARGLPRLPARPESHVRHRGDGGRWIYAYDDNKTVTQVIDPYGQVTRFILDDLGRPIQEIDPNGGIIHDTPLPAGERGMITASIRMAMCCRREMLIPIPADPLAPELPTTLLRWEFGRRIDARTIQRLQANDPILAQFPAAVVNAVLGKTAAIRWRAIPPPSPHRQPKTCSTRTFPANASPKSEI